MRKSSRKGKIVRGYVIIATVAFSVWLSLNAFTAITIGVKAAGKMVNAVKHSVPMIAQAQR